MTGWKMTGGESERIPKNLAQGPGKKRSGKGVVHIKDIRTKRGGGLPIADATDNFVGTGGGPILRTSLMNGPFLLQRLGGWGGGGLKIFGISILSYELVALART